MKQQNILIITTSMKPSGVSKVCENLSYALRNKNHAVTLLSLSNNASTAQLTKLSEQKIAYVHTSNKVFSPRRAFIVGKDVFLFSRKNKQFGAIYIASLIPAIICLTAKALAQNKAKTVVNFHTTLSAYFKSQNKLKTFILKSLLFIVKKADILATDSIKSAEDAKEVLRSTNVHCLYNPVCTKADLNYISSTPPHPWFKDDKLTVFITCGRLCKEKNFSRMLQSFYHLQQKQPHSRLIIIGEGPLEETLKQESLNLGIDGYVDFLGFKNNPKEYFYHANYFWLTSNLEGFSLVLAEALSMGVNCISVDCPHGPREILQDGKIGLLIPMQSSAEEMAGEICNYSTQFVKEKSFYRDRAQDFTDEKAATTFLNLINSL